MINAHNILWWEVKDHGSICLQDNPQSSVPNFVKASEMPPEADPKVPLRFEDMRTKVKVKQGSNDSGKYLYATQLQNFLFCQLFTDFCNGRV